MSMFDSIMLDEFTMLDEGKQADEYKARKAGEEAYKKASEQNEKSRYARREAIGSKPIYKSSKDAAYDEPDKELQKKFSKKARKDGIDNYFKNADKITGGSDDYKVRKAMQKRWDSGKSVSSDDYNRAYDASRRHARRHPKTESALMLIAGYESEFTY